MRRANGAGINLVGSALGCVLAAFGAVPASATQITYTSYNVVDDVNVHISCPTITGCASGYYGSGEIEYKNGNTVVAQSWCIDVTHDLLPSGVFEVTLAQNTGGGMSNIRNDGGSGTGSDS